VAGRGPQARFVRGATRTVLSRTTLRRRPRRAARTLTRCTAGALARSARWKAGHDRLNARNPPGWRMTLSGPQQLSLLPVWRVCRHLPPAAARELARKMGTPPGTVQDWWAEMRVRRRQRFAERACPVRALPTHHTACDAADAPCSVRSQRASSRVCHRAGWRRGSSGAAAQLTWHGLLGRAVRNLFVTMPQRFPPYLHAVSKPPPQCWHALRASP
jgi:hypothetical protein